MKPKGDPLDNLKLTRRTFIKGVIATSALAITLGDNLVIAQTKGGVGRMELMQLPYPDNALEPYISARTISFHYGKHHRAYLDNTNKLIEGTDLVNKSLVEIIKFSARKEDKVSLFNNSAQTWNHNFYWNSMKPAGGGKPSGKLAEMIDKDFGSFEKFKDEFINAAVSQFGSGWAWLVLEKGTLKVTKTANADNPLIYEQVPLLTVDVWEHAYYLDYQNRRKDYVTDFIEHLVNWDFATKNLNDALSG